MIYFINPNVRMTRLRSVWKSSSVSLLMWSVCRARIIGGGAVKAPHGCVLCLTRGFQTGTGAGQPRKCVARQNLEDYYTAIIMR